MAVNTRMAGLVAGIVLIVLGIALCFITEPAGREGSGASGGIPDVSEEERPYVVWGILCIVAGVIVAAFAWRRGGTRSAKKG